MADKYNSYANQIAVIAFMHKSNLLIVIIFLLISFSVVGVQTFGSDSSDPTQPMSFPNYSDPLVANWSTGHDSITLTPSIFDSAVLGE